jgi:hypothetical protein
MTKNKQTIEERIKYLQMETHSKRNDGWTNKGMKEELKKLIDKLNTPH